MRKYLHYIVLGFIIFSFLFFFFFYNLFLPRNEVIVTIAKGSTARDIAEMLYEKKLIWNKSLFLFLVRVSGIGDKLKSGSYKFHTRMNIFQIISKIVKGDIYMIKLTIPEGMRAEQIAELIELKGLGSGEEFLGFVMSENLEGYLFPTTYFFPYGISEKEIAKRMVREFHRNFTAEMKTRAKEIGFSIPEVVTLASIIESETKAKEEKALISAVYHNRLKKGWKLEADVTVRYALKKFRGRLTYADLEVNSPYNTYRHWGLPPGPICNPGLDSIIAALYPADTTALFFFANGKGTHIFSKYYQEHLRKQRELKRK